MATAQLKLTEREVRFARAFLHALHANETNGYLLLAVIAWMRGQPGTTWAGNNPLQLKSANGTVLRFSTYKAAAYATAQRLLRTADEFNGYGLISKTARRSATGEKAQVEQAQDFLASIALSLWDDHHFGLIHLVPKGGWTLDARDLTKNTLLPIWQALTGQKIPAKWFVDTVAPPKAPPPPKPPFRQARAGQHSIPKHDYIDPYGARNFYDARPHAGAFVLVD